MSVTSCPSARSVRQQQLITGPRILAEEHPTKCLWVYLLSKVEMLLGLATCRALRPNRRVAAGRVHRPEAAVRGQISTGATRAAGRVTDRFRLA